MTKEELEKFRGMDTATLYGFMADNDFSPRKKAALDILEERKMAVVQEAALSSARAAKWSAVAAVVSAAAAVAAILLKK